MNTLRRFFNNIQQRKIKQNESVLRYVPYKAKTLDSTFRGRRK